MALSNAVTALDDSVQLDPVSVMNLLTCARNSQRSLFLVSLNTSFAGSCVIVEIISDPLLELDPEGADDVI